MMQRGNYVIPQLVGSEIVTKPPLFYWALVGSFSLPGSVAEWTARAPSVLFSIFLVLVQYLAVRAIGGERKQAAVSALMLATGMLFLLLGSVAEIDMMFGLFCALALYGLYFALEKRSLLLLLAAYFAAGIAFLIKGPPIVFFFAASLGSFYIWQRTRDPENVLPFSRLVLWNCAGSAVFSALALVWLSVVADRLGWEALYHQFDIEVFQRVVAQARQERGVLFYLQSLASGLAPWTVLLFIGAAKLCRRSSREKVRRGLNSFPPKLRSFLAFSALTTICGLVMLSLAQSKSSRYIFPIYPFAMNLAFGEILLLETAGEMRRKLRWVRYAAPAAGLAAFCAFVWFLLRGLPGVGMSAVLLFAAVLGIALSAVWIGFSQMNRRTMLGSLLMLALAIRIGEREIFVPFRNTARSVKAVALDIDKVLPSGVPLYTIEMFERWIVYYLKHLGRETYRITPRLAAGPLSTSGRVYLLLNTDEESWRLPQLGLHDPTLKVVKRFELGKDSPLLIEVDSTVLRAIRPHETFPTFPTPPYYTDEERRLLNVKDGEFPKVSQSDERRGDEAEGAT